MQNIVATSFSLTRISALNKALIREKSYLSILFSRLLKILFFTNNAYTSILSIEPDQAIVWGLNTTKQKEK